MASSKEEILEKFVEWFDANAVGEKFDGFIRENAGDFAGASSEGEQELSRMELYKRYQAGVRRAAAGVCHARVHHAGRVSRGRALSGRAA